MKVANAHTKTIPIDFKFEASPKFMDRKSRNYITFKGKVDENDSGFNPNDRIGFYDSSTDPVYRLKSPIAFHFRGDNGSYVRIYLVIRAL